MSPRSTRSPAPPSSRESRSQRQPPASRGRVSIVGAGVGDPDMITVRGVELLGEADLVVVESPTKDALVGRTRKSAEIRVADDIFDVVVELVEAALEGKEVVYLVEGDPFLFGRAPRAIAAFLERGVRFECVPGVPHPVAAAAFAGIPLTGGPRGAIALATGEPHVQPVEMRGMLVLDPAFELVLQGLLREEHEDTPAAVVQFPYAARRATIVSTLGQLAGLCRQADVRPPFVLFVGEHVLRHAGWYETQPLFGCRVLVMRSEEQSASTARLLRRRGAIPLQIPLLHVGPPDDLAPLDASVRALSGYDVVAFTSANGVDATFAALERASLDPRAFGSAQVAAIGPGTARALANHAIRADIVAEDHRGEGLAEAVLGAVLGHRDPQGARVLLLRAAVARAALPTRLREAGVEVDDVAAYRLLPARSQHVAAVRDAFQRRTIDVVAFTSPSTVDAVCDAVEDRTLFEDVLFASIGPITSEAARARGLRVDVEAPRYTVPALVEALEERMSR